MSRKYKFWDNNKLYFISFATVNWVDLFIRNEYRDEMLNCWKFCQQNKGLQIFAWCIMPSHIHMIIGSSEEKLADIVRDMKRYTSTKLKKAIEDNTQESRKEWILWMFTRAGKKNGNNNNWQLWQQHNKPIEINDKQTYASIVNYIHNNPIASGFVYEAEDWVYSSAKGYAQNNGLLKLVEY